MSSSSSSSKMSTTVGLKSVMNSENTKISMDAKVWGPHYWFVLFTMASCYGQPTMLTQGTAGSMLESPGYLCVESSDLGILGDLNDDGHVNGIDLAIVLGNWGACGAGACVADIDRDGWVNGVDLAIVLGSWG